MPFAPGFRKPQGTVEANITWNPADIGPVGVLSNGNLDFANSSGGTWAACRPTVGKTAGKWYGEILVVLFNNVIIGAMDGSAAVNTYLGASNSGCGQQGAGARLIAGWTAGTNPTTSYGLSAVGMVAFDLAAGKLWIGVNGTWFASGDPASGANPIATGLGGSVYIAASTLSTGDKLRLRTKLADFTYSPPSGFLSYATP